MNDTSASDGGMSDARGELRDVIGYHPIGGGGISNQKMALLGLFLTAHERGSALCLPKICMLDQVRRRYDAFAFEEVFDLAAIMEFADRKKIQVVNENGIVLPHGYDDYFWHAWRFFETKIDISQNGASEKFLFDFLRSLVSRISGSYMARCLRSDVFDRQNVSVSAQFRIELDWERHCRENLSVVHKAPEDMLISFDQIVGKIYKTLPGVSRIYVICDEPALPVDKQTIRNAVRREFNVDLIWKSDLLTRFDLDILTPLHLSLLDFEIAMNSEVFVGITRSTFSNMATLSKCALKEAPVKSHYVYNLVGPILGLRTDNGAFSDPVKATRCLIQESS